MKVNFPFLFALLGGMCGCGMFPVPVKCTHLRKVSVGHLRHISGIGSYSANWHNSESWVYYCDGWERLGGANFDDSNGLGKCLSRHPQKKYFRCTVCKKGPFNLSELKRHFDKMAEVDREKEEVNHKRFDVHKSVYSQWLSNVTK